MCVISFKSNSKIGYEFRQNFETYWVSSWVTNLFVILQRIIDSSLGKSSIFGKQFFLYNRVSYFDGNGKKSLAWTFLPKKISIEFQIFFTSFQTISEWSNFELRSFNINSFIFQVPTWFHLKTLKISRFCFGQRGTFIYCWNHAIFRT